MSMTKYEFSVDYFQGQMDLSLQGMPILEALNAGAEAIELVRVAFYNCSQSLDSYTLSRMENLLKDWD